MSKQMGSFFVAAWIVVALTVHTADAAPAGKVLRWKLKPGETLKYRITQDMAQNVRVGDAKSPMAFSTKMNMDLVWKVDSVDDHGVITFDQIIDRIEFKTQSPQGVLMEYDSASGKEPEGMAKLLAPMFESMVKKPFRTTITSRGEIKKVKLPSGMLESMNKLAGGQMGNLLSEDSMKQFGLMSVFPERPVTPGQSWTRATTMKAPFLGSQIVTTNCRYVGTEIGNGRTLDKIDLAMTMKTEEKKKESETKPAEKPEATSGFTSSEGKGILLFDNAAGRCAESTMKMKMSMEFNVMGQKVVQDMEMQMHMGPPPDAKVSTPSATEK